MEKWQEDAIAEVKEGWNSLIVRLKEQSNEYINAIQSGDTDYEGISKGDVVVRLMESL